MRNKQIVFFTFFFFIIGFIGIHFHELWRDELQPWSIAKASNSFSDLWFNSRYDARPILWYGYLFFLSKWTDNMLFMQLSHLLIATLTALVFLRYTTFSLTDKLLIIFGYFFIYEYAVISRVYALGVLLLFIFCAAYNHPSKSYLHLSLILFFICLNNVFACIIAISLLIFWVYDYFLAGKWTLSSFSEKIIIITSIIISIAGILSYVFISMPPKDSTFLVEWKFYFLTDRILETLATLWNAFVPIPNLNHYQFWNSNIITWVSLKAIFSLLIMSYCILIFIPKRQILLLYLIGTLGIMLFVYLKYFGYLRHHGHFFLLFIVCLWLEKNIEPTPISWKYLNNISTFAQKYKTIFIRSVLFIHLFVGIYAYWMEIKYPFSASKMTADFIKQNHLENIFIIGSRDVPVYPVATCLQKPIYFIASGKSSTFILFADNERKEYEGNEETKKSIEAMQSNQVKVAIWILNHPFSDESQHDLSIRLLEKFETSIVPDEIYYIYSVNLIN